MASAFFGPVNAHSHRSVTDELCSNWGKHWITINLIAFLLLITMIDAFRYGALAEAPAAAMRYFQVYITFAFCVVILTAMLYAFTDIRRQRHCYLLPLLFCFVYVIADFSMTARFLLYMNAAPGELPSPLYRRLFSRQRLS